MGLIIVLIDSKIKSSKFDFVRFVILLKNIFETLEIIIDEIMPTKNIANVKNKFSENNFIFDKNKESFK